MSYIFIDESGDLGTKKSSSKYFVMAGIKVEDSQKLDRVIRKIKRDDKKNIITSNEIKGSNLPHDIKIKILKKLDSVNYQVFIIIFEKINRYKVNDGYDNIKLYDLLACELAKQIDISSSSKIFIDKSKNKKEEIVNFNKAFLENLNNFKKFPIKLEHANSMSYKGLQIADLISWAIFQSVEHNNNEFIDLIKNKKIKRVFEEKKNL
ncbi:DUF3800 domain-containing protein [Methanobrevibacter ruminantium]|nr:DUF3800 domain-containing protein [Methanobrevibacter ruminantium]